MPCAMQVLFKGDNIGKVLVKVTNSETSETSLNPKL